MIESMNVTDEIILEFQNFANSKNLGITLNDENKMFLTDHIRHITKDILIMTPFGYKKHPEKIRSQSERLELLSLIIECFEDLLTDLGTTDIPNEDKEGDEDASLIYGEDYSMLENAVSYILEQAGGLYPEQQYMDMDSKAAVNMALPADPDTAILLITIGFSDMSRENILLRVPKDQMDSIKELIIFSYETWQEESWEHFRNKDSAKCVTLEEYLEDVLKKHHIQFSNEEFDVVAFDLE